MKESKIEFEPVGDDLYNVIYPGRLSHIAENASTESLTAIIEQEPYNFAARQELASRLLEDGHVEEACEVRHQGALIAMEALPYGDDSDDDDDDIGDIQIAWDNSEGNRNFVGIIAAAGEDNYMFGDFEMAAAMLETVLILDSEDHLDVTPKMLCCFAAMGEWEAFDLYKIDLAPKSLESLFVVAFADFVREGASWNSAAARAAMPELVAELRMDDHPQDDRFLSDIEAKRPPRTAQARAVWLRHTPIWASFDEFVAALTI